ncbi:MAG: VOC family protein [Thermoproteota archaeon]|nr:VOC family protein [Thermoproteota archaeon]
MRIRRIIETCIYSSDLETMKNFYINKIGLEFSSEERGRHIFLKAGRSMLLIFNPENTKVEENSRFPVHGVITPPASIHFALEIEKNDYENSKNMLIQKNIAIEKEIVWGNGGGSIYFRDPAGNLVEFITEGNWPVKD